VSSTVRLPTAVDACLRDILALLLRARPGEPL